MVACSLFLSFSNLMLPNWSTVETTFNIPAEEEDEDEDDDDRSESIIIKDTDVF